jgi:hypothetical protein
MTKVSVLMIACAASALAACDVRDTTGTPAQNMTADASSPVVREEVAPAPVENAAVAVPVTPVIQTQPGPKGHSVALNKVAVAGDILTVATTFSGGVCCSRAKLDEVSLIDDATSQRITVLKDNAGNWMAGPLDSGGKEVIAGDSGKTTQIWFKFPAPPLTTKTVSITIPGVAPFDAVPVTR